MKYSFPWMLNGVLYYWSNDTVKGIRDDFFDPFPGLGEEG
jgi:hypothetical protein